MSDFYDCVNWRIVGDRPNCAEGLPLECDTCPSRKGRNGNFMHPPVYYVPAVHPALAKQAPQRRTSVAAPPAGGEVGKPCCQDKVMEADRRIRGLGDVIAAATTAVGIKPCGRCKRDQERLNRLVPFGRNPAGGEPAPE